MLEGNSSSRTSQYRISIPIIETKRSISQLAEDTTPTKRNTANVTKVSHLHRHKSTIISNTSEIIGSSIITPSAGAEIQSQIGNIASILKTARASSIPLKREILSFEDKKKAVEKGSRTARYIVNTKMIEAEIRETLISYDVVDKNGKKPSKRPGIYTGRRRSLIKLNDASVLKTGGNIVDNDYTTLSKRLMTKYVHEVAKQFVSYNAAAAETPKVEKSQDSSAPRKKYRKKKHGARKKKNEDETSVGKEPFPPPENDFISIATPVHLSEDLRKMKISKSQPRQASFFDDGESGELLSLCIVNRKERTPTGSMDEINEKDWKLKKKKEFVRNQEEPLYNIDVWDNGEKQKESVRKPQERKILLSYSDKKEVHQKVRGRQLFGNTLLKRANTPEDKSLSEWKNRVATISEETFEQEGFHKGLSPLIQDLIL